MAVSFYKIISFIPLFHLKSPQFTMPDTGQRSKHSTMACLTDLPVPLIDNIVQLTAESCGARHESLLALACANKALAIKLRETDGCWETVWAEAKRRRPAAAIEEQEIPPGVVVTSRNKLRLAGFTGCMLCGAKSIWKVDWEFRIRCCKACLIAHSIAEYLLQSDYKLSLAHFSHLPHQNVFTMKTYWKDDILPIIRHELNAQSFEELDSKRNNKRKERCQQLRKWCQQDGVDLSAAHFSKSYRRNCGLAAPLKRKAYERILPVIMSS